MVAGAGPRMLRLAGREADIINIAPRPPTLGPSARGTVGFGLDIHSELAIVKEAAGDRYDGIELCIFADRAVMTSNPEPELEKLAAEFGISRQQLFEMPHTLIGEPAAMEETLLRNRETYGINYYVVPGALMESFAPVVKRLSGT
jgi:hypothetical protein